MYSGSRECYPDTMKIIKVVLLVLIVFVAGCTVWIQAAGRSASSTQYGNNEDKSTGSQGRTPSASQAKEMN